jgi:uncharacterized cupin superfamily protein
MPNDSPRKTYAIDAAAASPRIRPSNYPEQFAVKMAGRVKHPLGDLFELRNFGVNLTRLAPGAASALHHRHSKQDEFVYILEGNPTLHVESETIQLQPGTCAGFPASGPPHHLVNKTDRDVVYLEVGDRSAGDQVSYPSDDLDAVLGPDRKWLFTHKNGEPY